MLITNNITGEVTEVEDIISEPIIPTSEQIEQQYKDRVVSLIREKYTADDEFALLRKSMADYIGDDTQEFDEYNEFVEGCKAQAKLELGL